MQSCPNGILQATRARWLGLLIAIVAVHVSADPPVRHAESNACGIDYSRPENYLAAGTQTALTREDWEKIQPELQFARIDLAALKRLYAWKEARFKSIGGGGKFVGRHTVRDLLRDRTLTGCHDHGLIVAAILRHCGVPAVFVDATGIEWALEYPDKTQSFRGHVFVEAYLDNAWMLLDSVTGEYVPHYNPLNPLIPLPKPGDPKGFYVMFKGLDPAGYGITGIEQLNRAQAGYASMIRSEMQSFRYPRYVAQRLH
jgi:hypothetical protein